MPATTKGFEPIPEHLQRGGSSQATWEEFHSCGATAEKALLLVATPLIAIGGSTQTRGLSVSRNLLACCWEKPHRYDDEHTALHVTFSPNKQSPYLTRLGQIVVGGRRKKRAFTHLATVSCH